MFRKSNSCDFRVIINIINKIVYDVYDIVNTTEQYRTIGTSLSCDYLKFMSCKLFYLYLLYSLHLLCSFSI